MKYTSYLTMLAVLLAAACTKDDITETVTQPAPENAISFSGQMKPAEKEEEMQRFLRNETQIMVATTVIEVGVNVPNASVMVIENAERFGLSQLHQLRGRVGRGADQSYCILVTGYKLTEETRKRIEIMVQTNDGFEIAEADLKLRGPGDLEGTQQSGVAFDLKIADIARDGQLLQYVRDIAERLLDEDPDCVRPENADQLPFEFVSGLFSRFYSSDSPLSSSQKQKNILENNSQTKAEQNLNKLLTQQPPEQGIKFYP